MPQHVVVVGVGGEARRNLDPGSLQIGGDPTELVGIPGRVDQHS